MLRRVFEKSIPLSKCFSEASVSSLSVLTVNSVAFCQNDIFGPVLVSLASCYTPKLLEHCCFLTHYQSLPPMQGRGSFSTWIKASPFRDTHIFTFSFHFPDHLQSITLAVRSKATQEAENVSHVQIIFVLASMRFRCRRSFCWSQGSPRRTPVCEAKMGDFFSGIFSKTFANLLLECCEQWLCDTVKCILSLKFRLASAGGGGGGLLPYISLIGGGGPLGGGFCAVLVWKRV